MSVGAARAGAGAGAAAAAAAAAPAAVARPPAAGTRRGAQHRTLLTPHSSHATESYLQ